MEIIKRGSEDVREVSLRSCCWPPGSETLMNPEPAE